MTIAKIIVGIIGLSVGLVGTASGATAAVAPSAETAIVTVSGSAGIVAE